MDLRTYVANLTPEQRADMARCVGVSVGQLNNWIYGLRRPNPKRAVAIERATNGAVSRKDLFSDWQSIWPELVADGTSIGVRSSQFKVVRKVKS